MVVREDPKKLLLIESPGMAALSELIESADDQPVCVRVSDWKDATRALRSEHFDAIVHHNPADEQDLEDLSLLVHASAATPVVVVVEQPEDEFAFQAMRLGVQDIVVRNECVSNALSRSVRYAIERHRLQRELRDLSLRDELTGLSNRRGFFTFGEPNLAAANRLQIEIGVVYADLDNLKEINDKFGHAGGDEALRRTAKFLTTTFRSTDALARLGGDEFAALALGASPNGKKTLLFRLRSKLQASNLAMPDLPPLSLSIGMAFHEKENPRTLQELIEIADAEMYAEKKAKKAAQS